MTRKDYVLLADTIRNFVNSDVDADLATAYRLTCKMATALASDNPRFDMQRFLVATGLHG